MSLEVGFEVSEAHTRSRLTVCLLLVDLGINSQPLLQSWACCLLPARKVALDSSSETGRKPPMQCFLLQVVVVMVSSTATEQGL